MKKATIFQHARVCRFYHDCDVCPLNYNKIHMGCFLYICEQTEKANEFILNWCEEHPIETRQNKFLKMFPNAKKDSDGIIKILPCSLEENIVKTTLASTCSYIHGGCNECRKEYWLTEVEDNE